MIEKIKEITNKKSFHVIVITIIMVILFFILGITILDYNENGESNMPFNISKISIISTSEGIDKVSEGNKWAFDINQNNDIFVYIKKNDGYGKTETIKSIVLDNFQIEKQSEKGEMKIFKPDTTSEIQIFTNKEENVENSLEYVAGAESNFKNLQISNQGDKLAFRYSNVNVASYESNEEEEINHAELLKKSGTTMEDLKGTLSFDITINLDSGKIFKANVKLEMPIGDIIENASQSIELTDFEDVVFKRIKN